MRDSDTDVTILVPKDSLESIPERFLESKNSSFHSICFPPRYLWTQIHELLVRGDTLTFRRLVWFLRRIIDETAHFYSSSIVHPVSKTVGETMEHEKDSIKSQVTCRRLRSNNSEQPRSGCFYQFIWVYPDHCTKFDDSFESRLNLMERVLIRAQSMAGYYATMGGGFYMCHHWTTAIQLAQRQQVIARMLGDKEMYYKCGLNQAYNYIFAGLFVMAKGIIRDVYLEAGNEAKRDLVILNMCKSAWLFCKRVQRAKLKKESQDSGTVDNFSRIRLVDDKSSNSDLLRTRELLQ